MTFHLIRPMDQYMFMEFTSLLKGIANCQSPTAPFSLFNVNVGSQKITITKYVGNVGRQTGFCQKDNDIKNNAC